MWKYTLKKVLYRMQIFFLAQFKVLVLSSLSSFGGFHLFVWTHVPSALPWPAVTYTTLLKMPPSVQTRAMEQFPEESPEMTTNVF